ncbi:hypothetical protein ACIBOV_15780 [Micromonospora chersina]|uniref:hypothetical protein n=1 Tax=Micromonospora chersina TaxID=47854 RepID=UPI00379757B0
MNSKPDRTAYLDWVADVATLPYPGVAAAEPLRLAAMKPGAKWHEFRLFLIYAFTQHGRYGRRMFAGQETLADGVDVSRPTVKKWLTLADALGLIRKTEDATRIRAATYEISEDWKLRLAEPVPASTSGRFSDPWGQDSPPY